MRLFTIDAGYKYDSYRIGPRHLTEDDKEVVKLLRHLGFPVHRIAALFDMNQGRISEAETDRGEVPK
jgi:hypothetical protein